MVEASAVQQFLAANRIRYSGCLDSLEARSLGHSLGCDLVLVGSITERTAGENASFGLLLQAMDTGTGQSVWTAEQASSLTGQTRFMGIGEAQSLEELQTLLITDLATDFCHRQQPATTRTAGGHHPFLITDLRLTPPYAAGGAAIECSLDLRFLAAPPDQVVLQDGQQTITLEPQQKSGRYAGSWQTSSDNGCHPISVALSWADEPSTFVMKNLASYEVANLPPRLELELKRGQPMGAVTVFNDKLLIIPHVTKMLPLSRWCIEVKKPDGTVLVREMQSGAVPKLVWNGCRTGSQRLEDGLYDVVLQIWDAADQKAEASKRISLQTACRPLTIKTTRRQDRTIIILAADDHLPNQQITWQMRLTTPGGNEVLNQTGSFLPAEYVLPPAAGSDFLLCQVEARDQAGNRFALRDVRVKMPDSSMTMVQETRSSHIWQEDF
ncbi:MAG: hypothetical protein JXO50_03645 [Deltaproteobacteria bacterium]|nr:hypothetical protein [Candidatus Anaeroferrophillus wilburensis]